MPENMLKYVVDIVSLLNMLIIKFLYFGNVLMDISGKLLFKVLKIRKRGAINVDLLLLKKL